VPTVAVSIEGVGPRAAAETLGRQGIYVWDGDFYATGLIERLGKAEVGGVLRVGLVHYNTAGEVDRTLEALEQMAAAR
jgi:selenocysteine lyase/cysteine desulfurase